jgi:hypothetical protein
MNNDGLFNRKIQNIENDYDCCLEAMKLEGTAKVDGGSALRFQLRANGECRIDQEMMMNMNLDSSSGLAYNEVNLCGDDDEHLYFRHAAGGADASNLKTGGECAKGFQELAMAGELQPLGQVPDGIEIPNHICDPGDEAECAGLLRYNPIGDAEECCKVCNDLRFLDSDRSGGIPNSREIDTDGNFVNPCLAWQIVDGKCRIARQDFFAQAGSIPESVPTTIGNCAGFFDHDACHDSFLPNDKGYWGSCEGDNCNYYSSMFWRSDTSGKAEDFDMAAFRTIADLVTVEDLVPEEDLKNMMSSYSSYASSYASSYTSSYASSDTTGSTTSMCYMFSSEVEANVDSEEVHRELEGIPEDSTSENAYPVYEEYDAVPEGKRPHLDDCAQLQLYPSTVLNPSVGYVLFDESARVEPLCTTKCVSDSGVLEIVCCDMDDAIQDAMLRRRRRLDEGEEVGSDFVLVEAVRGSGYNTAKFRNGKRNRGMTRSTTKPEPSESEVAESEPEVAQPESDAAKSTDISSEPQPEAVEDGVPLGRLCAVVTICCCFFFML